LDLGYSDQIRFFKTVSVAMNDVGSLQLSKIIDYISERKNYDDRFYFTFDYQTRIWKGIWGEPKNNWKLDIGYDR